MRKSRREKPRYIACKGASPIPYLLRSLGEYHFGICIVKEVFSKGDIHIIRTSKDCFTLLRGLLSLTNEERCYPLAASGTLKALKQKLKEMGAI